MKPQLSASLLVAVSLAAFAPHTPLAAPARDWTPPLFAFCMDTHDAKKRSLAEQAALLKELGYAGAGHLWLDQVEERAQTLEAASLKLYQVYIRVDLAAQDQPPFDPRLKDVLPLLKPHSTMLAVLIVGGKPSDSSLDARACEVLRQMAELAQPFGVRLALYPHANDWLERTSDATRIANKLARPDVGVMFNLCHFLKVEDESRLRPTLEAARARLFAVSLNGADHAADIQAGRGAMILPLDRGTFDLKSLLTTLRDLGFNGPVGLQCWGLTGDARDHLTSSIAAWRQALKTLPSPPQ